VDYYDVTVSRDRLDEMLRHSNGVRKVPIIVKEDGGVQIGFNGA